MEKELKQSFEVIFKRSPQTHCVEKNMGLEIKHNVYFTNAAEEQLCCDIQHGLVNLYTKNGERYIPYCEIDCHASTFFRDRSEFWLARKIVKKARSQWKKAEREEKIEKMVGVPISF